MNTRPANSADLERLAELFDHYRVFYEQSSDLAAARAFLTARLEGGESHILCAIDDVSEMGASQSNAAGRIIGFAQLYPSFSSVSMQPIWVLNDLFVDPNGRRGGAGRLLLDAARDHALETGAIRLELATAKTNATAQSLYASSGWVRDDEYYHYSLSVAAKN